MNLNLVSAELQQKETDLVYCEIQSPYAMLSECLRTGDEAFIEQAWLCFTEFSADYMVG